MTREASPGRAMAPIALFVYRRPEHARRVLESLLQNREAELSPVTIFCDGPRSASEVGAVAATRDVVREFAPRGVRIIASETNLGLANSIIGGVTRLCEEYGRVIVLEDDLILSPVALRYFNATLDRYADDPKVMHVSGYMFPVRKRLPPAFFYREATCWGWATWASAWSHFEPDPAVIQRHVIDNGRRDEFDVNGSMSFWKMLDMQARGEVDSWAIRWYGSMFMQRGLALHPARSLVRNEGFDGTGVHCGATSRYAVQLSSDLPALPDEIAESPDAIEAMIDYRLGGRGPARWARRLRNKWRNTTVRWRG